MEIEYTTKQLFGGAIEAAVPTHCKDLSEAVIVPDNQEIFNDTHIKATLVIELLEGVPQQGQEAPIYLFSDLSEYNESTESSISSTREVLTCECPNLR